MSLMQSKIIDVDKCYWAAQKKRKEKLTAEMTSMIIADSHH